MLRRARPAPPAADVGDAGVTLVITPDDVVTDPEADVPISPPAGGGRVRFVDVLRQREFLGLFLSQLVSTLGDQLARLAIAILVFRASDSALLAAVSYAVSYLPALISGPLLGVLADLWPRRRVMVACDIIRAAVVALMLIPGLPPGALLGLVAVVGFFEPPFSAARSALLVDVLEGESYAIGQSLLQSTFQGAQLIGFGAGGVLVAFLGTRTSLFIDALTFVAAALLALAMVQPRVAAGSRGEQALWRDLTEGASFVVKAPLLRRLIGVTAVTFFGIIATEGLAVSYAHEVGHGTVATGLLTAALPGGSAVGLLLFSRFTPAARRVSTFRMFALLWPLPLIATVLRPPVAFTCVLWAAAGALSAYQLLGNVLFAASLPQALRSRAFAFATTLLTAAEIAGLVVVGGLAQVSSPSDALGIVATVGLMSCAWQVWGLRTRPAGRHHRRDYSVGASSRVRTGRSRSVTSVQGASGLDAQASDNGRAADLVIEASVRGPRYRPVSAYVVALLLGSLSVAAIATGPLSHSVVTEPISLRWYLLAAMFAVTSWLGVPVQRGRDATVISLTELPYVLGLFFVSPLTLLVAKMIGESVQETFKSRSPLKFVVNRGSDAVGILTALAIFHALGPERSVGWTGYLAGYLATIGGSLLSTTTLMLVRKIFDASFDIREILLPTILSTFFGVGAASLGLLSVAALRQSESSGLLLLLLGSLLVAGTRIFAQLQERHRDLGHLYDFTERLAPLALAADDFMPVLHRTRELLVAELVQVDITADTEGRPRRLWARADGSSGEEPLSMDEAPSLEARMAANALVVPLRAAGSTIGFLRAQDRQGAVRGFKTADLKLLETLGGQVSDALERGRLLGELEEAVRLDRLTGLLTLHEFTQQLDSRLILGAPWSVALIDVTRLRDVNDSLGHAAGDALLTMVASRLRQHCHGEVLLGRSGGGEFCIARRITDTAEAARSVLQLSGMTTGLVQILGISVDLRTRIGWAVGPDQGSDAGTLVRRADLALGAAKREHAATTRFSDALELDGLRRLRLLSDLRAAIEAGDLTVAYQPLISSGDRDVVGVEALARWEHPEFGRQNPEDFINLAEQSGLIRPLTLSILAKALEQMAQWHREGLLIRVAVNLSPRCLSDLSMPNAIIDLLAKYRVDPTLVTFEITESSLAENPTRSLAVLRRLRSVGLRLSVDDFGTGYSSLAALKTFPVQEVKLDKSFLDGEDAADDALLTAVVGLAHSLTLDIVAEGVETLATCMRLEALGVDVLQGFLFSRPLPGSEVRGGQAFAPGGSRDVGPRGRGRRTPRQPARS